MRPRRTLSLRARLALAGTAFVAAPIAVLLAAVIATTETVETAPGGPGPQDQWVASSPSVSPWLLVTATALALVGGGAAWWWSGRAIRPIAGMAAIADDIQQGSLDRRIRLTGEAREVQALGDSFDRMLDRLAEASANQRQLIEDTGHELRTPLATVAATTEVLLAGTGAQVPRADLERIERQVVRMQTTIDALLAGARSRAALTAQTDNDLMAVVSRVVEAQRDATPATAITVEGPAVLRLGIDGPAVERALANLLENAVRHSPPVGEVAVAVRVAEAGVELSVTDAGPGIDLDRAGKIFDRYHRVDASPGGAGLGLAIVKAVADAYGGITVTSPVGPDGGSRFTLRLPAPR